MAAHRLTVICAWCNRIVVKAPAGAGVTHTICPSCVDWTLTHPESRAGGTGASDLEELQVTAPSTTAS